MELMEEARKEAIECWYELENKDKKIDQTLVNAVAKHIAYWRSIAKQNQRYADYYCKLSKRFIISPSTSWTSVKDKLPCEKGVTNVVFYVKPHELWLGRFAAKGVLADRYVFEYHDNTDDDEFHELKGVTHWFKVPKIKD